MTSQDAQPHEQRSIDEDWSATSAPLVSVVIPCFNQAEFLGEAIESAAAETHSRVEIIVVDDGSTDETPKVAARYPDVTYLYKTNGGLSSARNAGIAASRGEFLVFLDSDDRLLPEAISLNLELLRGDPTAIFVSGHYRYINADATNATAVTPHGVRGDWYAELLKRNFIGMVATVLIRRAAFDQCGVFDETLRYCEDYDLFLRLVRHHPILCHDVVIAEYRRHGNALSNHSAAMLKTALHVLESQRSVAEAAGPRYIEAYRRGRYTWKNMYGRDLMLALRADVKARRVRSAARNARTLTPHVPAAALWQLKKLLGSATSVRLVPRGDVSTQSGHDDEQL